MNRFFPRLALFIIFLLTLVLFSPSVFAQSKSVTVNRRDGDITILANGDVRFVETWEVRFNGGSFTFAFRSIPLDRTTGIDGWGVSEANQTYRQADNQSVGTFSLTTSGNERKITWYFPPTTNQARTFTLSYTVHGGLRIYDSGDQLWWKFIESDRGYSISSARATVHLPAAANANQIRATTYLDLSENSEGARVVDGKTIAFAGGPFSSGAEWEIRVQFPHGTVTASPPPWQQNADAEQNRQDQLKAMQGPFNLIALFISLVVLIGGSLGLYVLWYTRGRDKPAALPAEFLPRPPEDIPPGVAGTLVDESADMQDILASIVDLARRGYIRIVEKSEPGLFGIGTSRAFTYERTRADESSLRPFERDLLDKIFEGDDTRELEDLKLQFYKHLPGLKDKLYDETIKAGYFKERPHRTKLIYGGLGLGALIFSCACGLVAFASISDYAPLGYCVVTALAAVSLGLLVLSPFMPKKTDKGASAAAKWRAFKNYLANIEKYSKVEEAKELFDQYLPFAVAFGLERSWVQKFERVNTPAPIWYRPYGWDTYSRGPSTLSADTFNEGGSGGGGSRGPSLDRAAGGAFSGLNSMSTGFFSMLNSTSSVFTSAPSSSGGGGGWSGGGGGGGGGGSSGFG